MPPVPPTEGGPPPLTDWDTYSIDSDEFLDEEDEYGRLPAPSYNPVPLPDPPEVEATWQDLLREKGAFGKTERNESVEAEIQLFERKFGVRRSTAQWSLSAIRRAPPATTAPAAPAPVIDLINVSTVPHEEADENEEGRDLTDECRRAMVNLGIKNRNDTFRGMSIALFPYQAMGVDWMARVEEYSSPKGGILADEMGLGKTVQVIAHLVHMKKRFTPAPRTGHTLIVVPANLILQWESEIKKRGNGTLSWWKWWEAGRQKRAVLEQYDVILTTYSGVQEQAVQRLHWHRVILDEAHSIKTPDRKRTKACLSLIARHRWCLTGTPIQNEIQEAWTLINFVQVPFYRDKGYFDRNLAWLSKASSDDVKSGMYDVFQTCMLRRSFNDMCFGKLITELESKQFVRPELPLSERWRKVYDELQEEARKHFESQKTKKGKKVQGEVRKKLWANCQRMCRFLAHPVLGYAYHHAEDWEDELEGWEEEQVRAFEERRQPPRTCSECDKGQLESRDTYCSPCGHMYCHECWETMAQREPVRCPVKECRGKRAHLAVYALPLEVLPFADSGDDDMDKLKAKPHVKKAIDMNAVWSDKFTFIYHRIEEHMEEDALRISALEAKGEKIGPADVASKYIVFSKWVKVLDILAYAFSLIPTFNVARYEGPMSQTRRAEALESFMKLEGGANVLLVSIEAGGTGLNLTRANIIFNIDPHWNYAKERQAYNRAHRVGQLKRVLVYALSHKDTIEDRIVKRQRDKAQMMLQAFGKGKPEDVTKALKNLADIVLNR